MALLSWETRVALLFNKPRVDAAMDQLVGVLLHEVHHVLLSTSGGSAGLSRWACIIAEEVTVTSSSRSRYPMVSSHWSSSPI
jgi:hypothetical protein